MNLAECIELVVSKQKYATYKIYIHDILDKELGLIVVRKATDIFFYDCLDYDICRVVGFRIDTVDKHFKYLEYHIRLRV